MKEKTTQKDSQFSLISDVASLEYMQPQSARCQMSGQSLCGCQNSGKSSLDLRAGRGVGMSVGAGVHEGGGEVMELVACDKMAWCPHQLGQVRR